MQAKAVCDYVGRCKLLMTLCVFLSAQNLRAQQVAVEEVPWFKLNLGTLNMLNVPPFSFNGAQCDKTGRAYFSISDPAYSTRLILSFSRDGRSPVPFLFPKDLDASAEWHFAISPDAEIYAIASVFTGDGTHTLIRYTSSGDVIARTLLQLPKGFLINSFAIQSNGRSMIQGFTPNRVNESPDTGTAPTVTGNSQTVFLDQNGKQVLLKNGKTFSLIAGAPGLVAAKNNGTFVEVSDTSLTVFSQSGDVLTSLPAVKPYTDSKPAKLEYIDGQIAIDFTRVDPAQGKALDPKHPELKFGPLEETWLLLNSEDGTVKGFYRLPEGFVGSSLCYLGSGEFLTIAVRERQAVFLTATVP